MSVQQSRTRAEDVDEATQELFTMADSIRDDGYYDVEITGWKKDGDQVEVTYQTPIDGEHSNRYKWPRKPTESNQFVQILMAALDLDDPVAAVSRADALKPPDGDALGDATVPCNADSGWNLKPSAAEIRNDEDESTRANQTSPGYMLLTAMFAPIMVLWFIMHGFLGWEDQRSDNNIYDTAKVAAATMFGMAIWTLVPLMLLLLL